MPAPDLATLQPLPHPYEPLFLNDGQVVTIQVRSWSWGLMTIKPRDLPAPKTVPAIRVQCDRPGKPADAQHFDLNQTQLLATIIPFLESANFAFGSYQIRAQGAGIRKTFSVEVSPPPPPPAAERFA